MEQMNLTPKTISKSPKLVKFVKILAVLLVFAYLVLLGVFTFINYKSIDKNEQTSNLLQKGMQLRNSYETLKVTRVQGTSYSQFPHRLMEIHADENTLYSYRDDFYKDYSEPGINIDKDEVVIYLTERQIFNNPVALAMQPECEAMARIESKKRQPESYEGEPTEITLKYQNKKDSDRKVYIYTPKLGHCKNVFDDSRLLRVQANAISIRYSY